VAQPGSALHWGCRGRWFKSSRSDHLKQGLSSFTKIKVPRKVPRKRGLCLLQKIIDVQINKSNYFDHNNIIDIKLLNSIDVLYFDFLKLTTCQ
jgi:hypothetical protein